MLVILDPELFRAAGLGGAGIGQQADLQIRGRLLLANSVLRALDGVSLPEIVAGVGAPALWEKLYRERIRPLRAGVQRETRIEIDRLVERGRTGRCLERPVGTARYYGVERMFNETASPGGWLPAIEQALAACALSTEPACAIMARVQGRNVVDRSSNGVALVEVTQCRLYVQIRGARQLDIACVSRARHISVPWTARFDVGLPATEDGARCPFCPPAAWWKRVTQTWKTHAARPCWMDAHGNAWARPRAGGEYHWDVYLTDQNRIQSIGLDQLNITSVGAPPSEGVPGSLHHVPADKRAALKNPNPRWRC